MLRLIGCLDMPLKGGLDVDLQPTVDPFEDLRKGFDIKHAISISQFPQLFNQQFK